MYLGLVVSPVSAQTTTAEIRRLAVASEHRSDWLQAVTLYDGLLRKDRQNPELRSAYLRSLRQLQLARRHRDPGYESIVQHLAPSQAIEVYQQVLLIVPAVYVDPYRAGLTELFASGVQELLYALDDEAFQKTYLPGIAGTDAFKEFRNRLTRLRDRRPGPTTREQARDLLLGIGQLAQDLNLTVRKNFLVALTLELACGACNALDEYTLFLTPGSAANEALGIDVPVGVGLEVSALDEHLIVGRVYPRGPADEAGIAVQDRIVRINGQLVAGLTPEMIADRLRGESGSPVEIEVLPVGQAMPQSVRLVRRAVFIPTVDHRLLAETVEMTGMAGMAGNEPVGYLRITSFQHSTLQEVKEALAQLQTGGARAIVLDLRGNGGGLFESAVKVAELFLPEGQLIVKGESPVRQFNRPFTVEGSNPLTLPLAVLVDGDTASAAEVVVGALKEQNRARLLGQPTFGKGLIQCIVPVTRPGTAGRMASALKITVARFFSPGKQSVDARGIAPHDVIDVQGEMPVNAAKFYLLGVLRSMNLR